MVGAARWTDRAKLTDSRKALSCVKLIPRHLRLQLATGSTDGIVRIYEAVYPMSTLRVHRLIVRNLIGRLIPGGVHGMSLEPCLLPLEMEGW